MTTGLVIADRYELQAVLGEGGFGTVHRALDRVLQRAVAIKLVADRRHADRVVAEARAAARLVHPAIVTIHDVGTDAGQPYLVMELVTGVSLRAKIREGRLDRATTTAWLRTIADVLATAHAAGVAHLDIKPENVLVTETGHVKVADFGLARGVVRGDAIVPSRIAGTVRYMAPEQLAGEPLDGRVDQYAWSIVAFELLAGIHPRDLRRDVDDETYVMSEHPPRLHEVAAESPELANVLARAMAKRPQHRFPSMVELLRAWDDAVDRPTRPPDPPAPLAVTVAERPPRPSRPVSRTVATLAGLAAIGSAIAIAAVYTRTRDAPAHAIAPSSTPDADAIDASAIDALALADATPPPIIEAPPAAKRAADCQCRRGERCRDGACERLPEEMPWTHRFSPKAFAKCDGTSPTCGTPCRDTSTCGAGEVCGLAFERRGDQTIYDSQMTCRRCPRGHSFVHGMCVVPCDGVRDCPSGFACSDRFGPKFCDRS